MAHASAHPYMYIACAMWHGGTRHRTWHGPCAMAALPLGHRHVRCPPRSPRTYIGLSPRKSQRHGRAVPSTVKFLALPAARPARWIELLLEDAPRRAAYSGDAATCGIHGARARARRAARRRGGPRSPRRAEFRAGWQYWPLHQHQRTETQTRRMET